MDPKVGAPPVAPLVQYMKAAGLSAKRAFRSANGPAWYPGNKDRKRTATVFQLALLIMSYGLTNTGEYPEKATGWDFSYLERTRRMVESPFLDITNKRFLICARKQ